MDIRGIEVTNQLRSAIRAKLLELGVRYDEELPDYILVMVVNKKSRQQMHEDLYLFLEKCTTPFVDWLHDQVLKKLQKVTVAKKKSLRELVPTVVVKQEEERKKKKICTTSFLEDHTVDPSADKSSGKIPKDDKSFHKPSCKSAVIAPKSDASQIKSVDKSVKNIGREGKPELAALEDVCPPQVTLKKPQLIIGNTIKETVAEEVSNVDESQTTVSDVTSRNLKRPLDTVNNHREISEKKPSDAKRSKIGEESEDIEKLSENARKLKSCVNKPKITSVVSVKNRLGVISPKKKFEKSENDGRYRGNEKRFEKHRFENNRNNSFQRGRNFDVEERLRRNREMEAKHPEVDKVNDIRTRLGNAKIERTAKIIESREKGNASLMKGKLERSTGTIKDRLGIANINKIQRHLEIQSQESLDSKIAKPPELSRDGLNNNKNIKNRLGPLKNHFRPLTIKCGFNSLARPSQSSDDGDCAPLGAEDEIEDDAQSITGNVGPIKSHIIAVNKLPLRTERKRLKPLEKLGKEIYPSSDVEEDVEDAKIPSKVIVTPRPLKPLQPTQKRATQSLLLRAVAEANQSVVKQKNPEPSLLEKKAALKHLKPAVARDVGQNLSVHFNSNKRLVMEKIQVELNTGNTLEAESKPYVPQPVNEEHMGIVMSLFQRSDDNPKFLVTLNGYNNNLTKEKTMSDDDERLEMEVNEDDELPLLTTQNDTYITNESESTVFRITDTEDDTDMTVKERTEENNENCNTENVEKIEEVPRKRRKLSPIVYNRPHSPNSAELKSATFSTNSSAKQKKPLTENAVTVIDKSREKCRYWPNCTLGNKCAYLHPPVMCSAFPACKFGDKCAYKHPKCKFGLSCTKLGCVFSHPTQQCKYHPFCNKPACRYSHPMQHSAAPIEASTQRAKFTWRRQD